MSQPSCELRPPSRFRRPVGVCGETSLPVIRGVALAVPCAPRPGPDCAFNAHAHREPRARNRETSHRPDPAVDPTLTLGIVGGIVLIESEPALPRCFDRPDVFHHSHPIPCLTANALARNGTSAHPSPSSANPLYLQERARPPPSSAIPHAQFTRGAPPGAKIRETTYPPSQDRYCAHVISPKKRRRSPQSPDAAHRPPEPPGWSARAWSVCSA